MSADDFQTKYASVMESMLKSAIAETTKLFETMVNDLKAEISKIKKENEDLKTRCSQFERRKSQPTVDTTESEPLPRPSDSNEKRDTAVQCDLVPIRTMLVEQCQPLRNPSLQNQQQQCRYEEMEYSLQEHNYGTRGEGNSQTTFIFVKQESVLKQEGVEPTVVCGQVSNAALPLATACGTEKEGPLINQECSTGEMLEKEEETQVALELPCLGVQSDLNHQSSEPEHSLVISFTAIKDGMEDKILGKLTSKEQPLPTAQQQSVVEPLEKEQPSVTPRQCQREGETSMNEQTDVTVHCTGEELAEPTLQNKEVACDPKSGMEESVVSAQPVRRRRGRPPKKAKHQQQPVKEIIKSPSTDVITEQEVVKTPSVRVEVIEVSSVVDRGNTPVSESPQTFQFKPKKTSSIITPLVQESVNTAVGDVENSKVGSFPVSTASVTRGYSSEKKKTFESQQLSMEMEATFTKSSPAKSLPAPSHRSRCNSVTLQDAMLLVEAMNQSTVENTSSSPKRMAEPPQTHCAPHVGTLQTVDEVPAETLQLPTETLKASGSQPIKQLSTTQLTLHSTLTNEGKAHIKVVMPKQHVVIPTSTVTSAMPSSTQKSVQSQRHLPRPLITSVAQSKLSNAMPHKIIVVPRSVPSLIPKLPTFVSTVVAAQNNSLLPASTAVSLPVGTPSLSPVPQKTIYVTSRKSLPIVPSQSTTSSKDQQSGILPQPKITIIIPRQVSAVEPSTQQSQTIVLTTKQESAEPAAAIKVSSPQELTFCVDAQTATDAVTAILPQKKHNTTETLKYPKQPDSFNEMTNASTKMGSSSELSIPTGLVPTSVSQVEQKLSAVVRLTRLPFSVSTRESVLVSRLLSNGSPESQSILKEGTTREKLSSVVISAQPPEKSVVSTNICPSFKETSVSVPVNTFQMSEQLNNIKEMTLLSYETCTVLGESYASGYVQPSNVSVPDLEKSAVAVSTTEPSDGIPTSNFEEEMISSAVKDCALPNNPPTEEKQSTALIQLTSITSKDTADPHSQMTKTQFLAQLAVSPIVQDLKKASSNDFADSRASSAETNASGKKRLQKNFIVARLRSHLRTHLLRKRTETNPERCTETETTTVSPKKLRLRE
ncbi:mucin-5AC isoform X2 [Lates calcarifer]|uniref:Mucin-5AC isoform X2 n=1 Tax=Lates calcarifer TaxID=8187 RepID=A0AAJ8DPX8_LATCA|nr:mucin-5AC isoform X2 [Lates calcarifer]